MCDRKCALLPPYSKQSSGMQRCTDIGIIHSKESGHRECGRVGGGSGVPAKANACGNQCAAADGKVSRPWSEE